MMVSHTVQCRTPTPVTVQCSVFVEVTVLFMDNLQYVSEEKNLLLLVQSPEQNSTALLFYGKHTTKRNGGENSDEQTMAMALTE